MANNRGAKPAVHTKKHIARLERERRQTRLILFSFIGMLIVAIGLLVYGYLDINYLQQQKPVAKVGSVEITKKDFQTRVKLQRNSLLATYNQYYQFGQMLGMDTSSQLQQIETQLSDSQGLGQNVLDAMIDEELVRQESAKRGITISDAEVEKTIQGAEGYYPDGSPTPTITPTDVTLPTTSANVLNYVTATSEFTATPETTATPEMAATPEMTATPGGSITPGPTSETTGTVEVVPSPTATATATLEPTATATATEAASATPAGTDTPEPTATPYTLEGFQEQYGNTIKTFQQLGLSEAQYRNLFRTDLLRQRLYEQVTADIPLVEEQVWARHILVADEATAKTVIERLDKGEDFGVLAAELSQDTGSGAQGGDLGWFGKGAMVAPFEEAAFSLKVGEISQPVQSDFGWHIIQVIARQERPLNAAEYKTAQDNTFQNFLDSLREPYGVETYDLWKDSVPTEPSFESMATDAALTAQP